jgi:hypothetical protein
VDLGGWLEQEKGPGQRCWVLLVVVEVLLHQECVGQQVPGLMPLLLLQLLHLMMLHWRPGQQVLHLSHLVVPGHWQVAWS